MHFKVWQFRIAAWEISGLGGTADIVRIIAVNSAVHLIVVRGIEGITLRGSVHSGLIYASELDICCDTLRYVEGVESYVAAVVIREETRADDRLCGRVRYPDRSYYSVYLVADWCLWVGGE